MNVIDADFEHDNKWKSSTDETVEYVSDNSPKIFTVDNIPLNAIREFYGLDPINK